MNSYTYSFDVFDTCLVRACGSPSYVFNLLARKVLGKFADSSVIADFVLIRKRGEEKARRMLVSNENEDVTLNEIYDFCDFSCITDIANHAIQQAELEIEDEVLLPILKTKEKISQLHKNGNLVIYISDMYLPKEFIVRKLNEFGFFVSEQLVFVSSEIRKTKQSGHLFDYVLQKLNLNTNYWIHNGDNMCSDYSIPKKMKIKAHLIQYPFNRYEKLVQDRSFPGYENDINLSAWLCRALRLSTEYTPQNIFAISFVAPIFVPYIYYVMYNAQTIGVKDLYFVARDGYICYLIANEFRSLFPDVHIHYMFASRKSLYLPGLEKLDFESIKEIVPLDKSINDILYALQISSFDYSHLDLTGLSNEQALFHLCEDKLFRNALTKVYKEQNALCAEYLKQIGLNRSGCAIVDVLGSRRCHKYMNIILRRNNLPEVFAYFFEVTLNRVFTKDHYSALNYQESFIHFPNYHHVSQPLYEQYFAITDQRRTVGYKKETEIIEPIFENDPLNSDLKVKIFEANKIACIKYAKYVAMYALNNPIAIVRAYQYCFGDFCHNPNKEYLDAFEGFFCTDGNVKYILLQRNSLIKILLHRKLYFRWIEGNLIYNSGFLYRIIRRLLSMRLNIKHNLLFK